MTDTCESYWNGRSVLVTGAGGFIGSHLCERLVEAGARVRAFVRYTSMNSYGLLELVDTCTLEGIEVYAGDILDEASVLGAMQGVDTVFHMAALPSIPYSLKNPSHVFAVNLNGSLSVLFSPRPAPSARSFWLLREAQARSGS